MTANASNQEWELNRRNVLKNAAVIGAVGTFGLPAVSGSVAASSHTTGTETLYLLETDTNSSSLYSIDHDGSTGTVEKLPNGDLPTDYYKASAAAAATADGTAIYVVDRDSDHLGKYDVQSETFTDLGETVDNPGAVVQLTYSPDGILYSASNDGNAIYSIDQSSLAFNKVYDPGVNIDGADIAFTADGTLYLVSNAGNGEVYELDLDAGETSYLGNAGVQLTGLAVEDFGEGNLVGSLTKDTRLAVINKASGQFDSYINLVDAEDNTYNHTYGDLTVAALEDVCIECDVDGLVAKFEFEEDEETESYTFFLEEGSDEYVSFESFTSKEDEVNEPMTATFGTEYCELYAVVKSGQEIEVQSFEDLDGGVTVETANDEKYAISFVSFYCTEAAAQDAADAFPSKGKGK